MKKTILFIPLLFLLMIFGCKEDAVTEPTEYEITISGKVVDENENPIENSNVTLVTKNDSVSTLSENDGTFSLQLTSSGSESAELAVKKNNYEEQSLLIEDITQDNVTDLTIVLSGSEITISGNLTELNEDGIYASENATIRLMSYCDDLIYFYETTDQNGNFSFDVKYCQEYQNEGFTLTASKIGYETIYASYASLVDTSISMQIFKIVKYFPLKVGNRWEYSKYSNAGDIYSNSWEGIEIWEITSIEGQNFDLDVFFTGSKTFYYTGTPTDTLFYENLKSSYKLKISEDGYLEPQKNLGDMPFWHSRGEYMKISHSMSLDGIYIFDSIDNRNGISYTILMGIGIKNYEYKSFDGNSGKYYTLDLLNFSEGG